MSSIVLSLLKDKGESVLSVSRKLGVKRCSVYDTLYCRSCGSRRIRLFISSVVGRPPSLLFPDLPQNVKIIDDFQFINSVSKQ